MADTETDTPQPPARLRGLASWQASRTATLGARLTSRRMPLGARADFAVLAALEEYGPLSQAGIGRRLGMDRNDVNGVLNRLQAEQLVDRQPDPADRRRNVITVTDAGRDRAAELAERAAAVQEQLLAPLDPAEREQFTALLAKLYEHHRQGFPPPSPMS